MQLVKRVKKSDGKRESKLNKMINAKNSNITKLNMKNTTNLKERRT